MKNLITMPCREDMIDLKGTDIIHPQFTNPLSNEIYTELVSDHLQVEGVDIQIDTFNIEELVGLLVEVDLQVWKKSTIRRAILIREMLMALVRLSIKTSKSAELRIATELDSVYKFKHNILNPLIKKGLISMSNPGKPKSSKQAYKLTNKGKILFKDLQLWQHSTKHN